MIGSDTFKVVMRIHAAPVVLISVRLKDRPHFMTATSFVPVSLNPPLALFCVNRTNDTHHLIELANIVGISLLSRGQESISRRFSTKGPERHQVDDLAIVSGPCGAPLVSTAGATMELRLTQRYEAGDHSIFVGVITSANARSEASPLLYYSGEYVSVMQYDPLR
ncbi:flavin reductase family protein [Bradyrhizobium sp. dw_78]|uniref:flavin reductase family protein n=1 Tax=Bradyrhizobium sp. dw_78 TaxID=2719793 RepID=UPI001BD299B4